MQMQFYPTNVTRRLRGAAAALPHWLWSLAWLDQPTPTHTSTMAEIRVHPLRVPATEEDSVKDTPTCQGGDRPITSRCPYKEIGRRVEVRCGSAGGNALRRLLGAIGSIFKNI